MNSEGFVCEFCKKSFRSLSNLNYHKKSAKYCLTLQNKKSTCVCTYCDKVFANNYTLQTHLTTCKNKKAMDEIELNKDVQIVKLTNKVKDLTNRVKELESSLKSSNSQVELLTKLVEKPVVINNTTTNNNNNNYTVQFNALFNNLDVFNDKNVQKSIKEISSIGKVAELEYNDIKQSIIGALVLHSINKFTFCTDTARKTMVVKNTNNEQIKTPLDDFLADYISYGNKEIRNYVSKTNDHIDELVNNDMVPDETWYSYEKSRDNLLEQLTQLETTDNPKNIGLLREIKSKLLSEGLTVRKQIKN